MLCLRCFGGFEALLDGQPLIGLRKRKTDRLLAYLMLRHDQDVPSSELAHIFWGTPDDDELDMEDGEEWNHPNRAQNSLNKSKGELKKALKEEGWRLEYSYGAVLFRLEGVEADLVDFDRAIRTGLRGDWAALRQACELSKGDAETELFRGWDDGWVLGEREKRKEQRLRALRMLADHEKANQNYRAAAEYLAALVLGMPELAAGWRDLMEAWMNAGEQIMAIRVYSEYRTRLKKIGLEAPPEMKRWYDEITRQKRVIECPEYVRPGGGESPSSEFYVERPADAELHAALERKDSIVLVKGPRQVGKTSLLARGIKHARDAKWKVGITDFQAINASEFVTPERLYLALAQSLAEQLDLDILLNETWNPYLTPNSNLERYVRREVLNKVTGQVVWVMDEVDRLFHCDFKDDVFGLFRSWHNKRSLDPGGPWSQLTLAMAYATEAHLFITDLNQSPFNVGTRLTLADFTREQVEALNARHKSPLQNAGEMMRYFRLVGGHPYLVRCGLYEMAAHQMGIADIEAQADRDDGVFGDHLARMLTALTQDAELTEFVQKMLRGEPCPTAESFYRLRSAGLIGGESQATAQPRCGLYATYLKRHLL
jgi:DNA-binding SARP family transcriptional activator